MSESESVSLRMNEVVVGQQLLQHLLNYQYINPRLSLPVDWEELSRLFVNLFLIAESIRWMKYCCESFLDKKPVYAEKEMEKSSLEF